MAAKPTEEEITRFADMFSAMGTGPRLRIMRVLLSAYPEGMVVGEIGSDLGIAPFAPSRKAQKRGPGQGEARRHLSLVFGKRGSPARAPGLPLRRVLYPQQSRGTAGDRAPVPLSAGAEAGTLEPDAAAVMDEVGLDISGLKWPRSKRW